VDLVLDDPSTHRVPGDPQELRGAADTAGIIGGAPFAPIGG
jgi:hypothetical protein